MRTPPPSTNTSPPGPTRNTQEGKKQGGTEGLQTYTLRKNHEDQAAHYQRNRDALLKNRREYLEANRDMINKRARDNRAIKREARQAEAAAAASTS